jgi:zinc/manganese transport system substrate-binding protein
MKPKLLAFLLLLAPLSAGAIEMFACEPEWGALLAELTPPGSEITVATTAFMDPHRLQAKPSLIAAVRRADLLVCTGAELEVGWLPLLLRRSGNAAIQLSSPGYFLAADYVRKLERPERIDRSQGDIHPQGNPHIQLNPHNIERVAKALAERLRQIDPAGSAAYQARLDDFLGRWQAATTAWETRATPLAGLRLVSHHRNFSYLADWLKLDMVGDLEPKPGIPPTASHLAALLERLAPDPPAAIVRSPYTEAKSSLWLSTKLNVPAVTLPYTVGGSDDASDLFGLFDATIAALEEIHR